MTFVVGLACLATLAPAPAALISPLPDKVPTVVPDRQDGQTPDRVRLTGWVGTRIDANEANRLAKLDPARLLEGYRKRPGRQTWDGEHVGKWLHAATLAWANTGDPALRQKLDYVAAELAKCQLEDGYLGTYLEQDRWTQWDVWAHKYNLIGLITYMRYTGNLEPLPACRRMADLLCKTFGDAPGQRDIIPAGHHKGMAPTSVLEPMVLLYRLTGEPRYLDFCKYILRAWEQPKGPKIISTLLTAKRVDKVGNGKAYEMLSCLNGALELYRTTGDTNLLTACLNAWQDIVQNRLYLTGAASYGEFFRDDFDLPNVANVGETCVTVTWLQFNAQLLRLTGEARFADQLERVVLNQLFGAQRCDGSGWGYYVQMEGKKPYSSTLDGHCCLSSGPRGVALIPTFATSTDADGVVVNLYDAGAARLNLRNGLGVTLSTQTRYPADDAIAITVDPAEKQPFTVKLRLPAWCSSAEVRVNGQAVVPPKPGDGYAAITRQWNKGDRIDLRLKQEPRVIVGDHKNQGKVAALYGPLVLAADAALLPATCPSLAAVAAAGTTVEQLGLTPESAPDALKCWAGARVFRANAIARKPVGDLKPGSPLQVRLIPFADAGGTGTSYKVWLPLGLASTSGNVLLDGNEGRSRMGNLGDSIIDGNVQTYVVTLNEKRPAQDWFAVTLDEPASITRVVFAHGKTFHNGGWFDTSAGKPRVEVKTTAEGQWEAVGELKDYPATTSTDAGGLKGGESFTCQLAAPRSVYGVRVMGKPASGDNPRVAFSSCAELQAYGGATKEPQWESLFNGKDLSGWVPMYDVTFVATNGNLRLVTGMGWLRTEKQYSNFILEAEWRALVPEYDSGLFMRAGLEGKPWPKDGWQVNLLRSALGSLVKGYKTIVPAETPPMPLNHWVKFRIEVRGTKVTLDVDGERAWEFNNLDAQGGYIGIQAENKAFDFRNLRIQVLP
jgi:uncharacterized protein